MPALKKASPAPLVPSPLFDAIDELSAVRQALAGLSTFMIHLDAPIGGQLFYLLESVVKRLEHACALLEDADCG